MLPIASHQTRAKSNSRIAFSSFLIETLARFFLLREARNVRKFSDGTGQPGRLGGPARNSDIISLDARAFCAAARTRREYGTLENYYNYFTEIEEH
ncbi:MAG: hypothetical protein ACREUU_09075, partial [Gammaproteobacteria bacterium]